MPGDRVRSGGEDHYERLYELMEDPELSLSEKRRRALALGVEYLDVANGHVQRRTDDGGTDRVVESVGDDPELLPAGTVLDRATTYCRRTVEADSPVALSNVPEDGWADDPAYREHGFDCYLGTTVFVDGEVYGTVCFVSREARSAEFTTAEKTFVELVARLLGREIEATEYERRIRDRERARDRSEEKYEALLELAPDAVFLAHAGTGEVVEANERASELTGYSREELDGMTVLDLHPAEERERYGTLLAGDHDGTIDRFDDGTPLRVRRSDGTDVPVEMSVRSVELDGRRLFLGIVRDVTERRERERDLERSREFLRRTQEAAALGGWEFDPDSGSLEWTDEVYRIHDLPLDHEVTPEDAVEFYHPEDRVAIREAFERLRSEGEPYDMELRLVTADGAVRWVRTIGTVVEAGDGDGRGDAEVGVVRGVLQDVTERKERERDLYVKDRAIEESSVGITIGDATREDVPIVYANRGFEELTGYSKSRVMGENCRFLQGEATDEATVAEIRDAVESAEPIRTEILNYRAGGAPFWNELTIAPVTEPESDEVTHFVGIQEDVTARKRRERLIEVLDRVLRHNLRNDMGVVSGYAGLIADRTDGELARMAAEVEETAGRLTDLSEKARVLQETVRDAEPLGSRSLADDVESVVAGLRADYPKTEFAVRAEDAGTVMATEQIRLAIRELGENAAKHGGGSPVSYRVETTGDGAVVVRVADRGPGLPDSERTVLKTGREDPLQHGAGLGLWLVNWIVTSLGGEVTATVDEGTTVTVRLPAASEGAGTARSFAALGTDGP